jgi:uncharacterized protein YbjT (DUF2867 family)
VARILILGGGTRGRRLAATLVDEGHAVRIVTRAEARRAEIEQAGAECFVGDPDRLGTLRAALENVTLACWLLATAGGTDEQLRALHDARLRSFLGQAIDTTMRGFLYEAGGDALPTDVLTEGARAVEELTARNAIPAAILRADPADPERWLAEARAAIQELLA